MGEVRQILSPYGVERKTGHTAQQNLESVNSYNMVGGCREKYYKGLFFSVPAFLDPSCSPVLSSLGYHSLDVRGKENVCGRQKRGNRIRQT